jgi:hypothetical protein
MAKMANLITHPTTSGLLGESSGFSSLKRIYGYFVGVWGSLSWHSPGPPQLLYFRLATQGKNVP